MENNFKNVQSFKWINHLKTITKSNKDKETMDEEKLQISQSSKSHSIVSLLKKLSLGKEKSKTPIKDNAANTVISVNGTKKICPKSIKVEESEDSAANSKNKLRNDDSIKILNDPSDAVNSCWIDWGSIKSDSVTNQKTTVCKNKSKSIGKSNLENFKTDTRFVTKNIKAEGNDPDVKSKCNNNLDVDELSVKGGLDHFDTEKVCKSKYDSDDNQNSSDDEVVERAPSSKVCQNKGAHRVNPIQKKDEPSSKEFHYKDGNTTSEMKQLMTSSSRTDNIPESFDSSLSKNNCWNYADPLKQYARNDEAQAGILCTQDTENNNTGIISEAEVNNTLGRLAEYDRQQDSGQRSLSKLSTVDSKVSKAIKKYIEIQKIKSMLEFESLSFVQKRNALMEDIDLERQKLFQEIDEYIKIQNIKKMLEFESLSHALKNNVSTKENTKETAEDHTNDFHDAFKSLSLNHSTHLSLQNSYGNNFIKSNNKHPELNAETPVSNCSFPQCNYSSPECSYNSSGSNHSSPHCNYDFPAYNYSSSPECNNTSPPCNYTFPECNNSSPPCNYNFPDYNYSSSPECNITSPECNISSPGSNYSSHETSCSSPGSQLNDLTAENESVEEFMAEMQNYVNYYFKFNNVAQNSPQKYNQHEQGKIWSALKNDYFKGITPKDQKASCSEKTKARNMLVNSVVFSKQKCLDECLKIYKEIRDGKLGTEDREVIHYLKPTGKNKYIRTNLHAAVMEGNLEKVFCIVEIHKQCHANIYSSINMRDRNDSKNRSALDRAQEKENSYTNYLLMEYLKENYAKNALSKVRANINRKKT